MSWKSCKKKHTVGNFLSEEEVVALLRWLKQRAENTEGDILKKIQGYRDYALIFMLVSSGLRASELLSLRWCDLVERDGKIVCYFVGKGGAEEEQPLFPPAVAVVRRYFRIRYRKAPEGTSYPLFTNIFSQNHEPLKYPNLRYILQRIGEEANAQKILKRKIYLKAHTLRRSYAWMFQRHNMSLKEISVLLRHADVSTTSEHYLPDSANPIPVLNDIFEELV